MHWLGICSFIVEGLVFVDVQAPESFGEQAFTNLRPAMVGSKRITSVSEVPFVEFVIKVGASGVRQVVVGLCEPYRTGRIPL